MNTELIILIGLAVIGVIGYVLYKNRGDNEFTAEDAREKILMLFLFAEKQDWINEDKWAWCVKQVYNFVPSPILKKIVKYETVEEYMKELYNEFKDYLNSDLLKIQ
jgi:hypothetical protein